MKYLLFCFLILLSVACGQTAVTLNPGAVPINATNPGIVSTISFSIASGAADAAGNVSLTLSASTNRLAPLGYQFQLNFIAADVTSISVIEGPTATAASKTAQCNTPTAGKLTCLVTGLNTKQVNNGVFAKITAVVNKTTTLSLSNVVAVGPQAGLTATVISGGGVISFTPAAVVASVACTWNMDGSGAPLVGSIEPKETVPCTFQMSNANGNTVIPTIADVAKFNVIDMAGMSITSIVIASGQASGSFILLGL